ncbi:MAG TPA: putative sulfate exporter family transporter, partial [Candidatus Polarisedimenticolia bacterium]|nr:putative sulfate exporter family transporter [Candidatus Polarisedimenticolia bacterium]
MEGVPEWPQAKEPPKPAGKAHDLFGWIGVVLPGVGLAILLALVGRAASRAIGVGLLGFAKSPVSEISLAVLFGLAIRNILGLPAVYEKGLKLCARTVLRAGIVLLGLKLSLLEAGQVGLVAVPVILVCITTALLVVTRINRALGLPARLGSLIAVGTSICGVSAIAATAPVIEAEEDEVSYAVACITLFGLIALFVYPFAAHLMFGAAPRLAGIFLGTAIHDTSQVAGAALMYRQQFQAPDALSAATVTKLVRNLCMAAVIPLIGARHRGAATTGGARLRLGFFEMVPAFVLAFLGAVVLRTIGDGGERAFGLLDRATWQAALAGAETVAAWCLAIAMASIGLGTGLERIRKLGVRPMSVGLFAALLV